MIRARKAKTVSDHSSRSTATLPPESRLDPFSGNWTIFAPDRTQRPEEFGHQEQVVADTQVSCPFCPGHESQTPRPVWIGRIAEDEASTEAVDPSGLGPGDLESVEETWAVRVVPNKFPAVDSRGSLPSPQSSKFFQREPICGGHEVIIESRNHVQSLTELDLSELCLVFHAMRDRLRHWRQDPKVAYMSIFKNVGGRAGASLRHSHSQMIATSKIPPAVRGSVDRMKRHRASTGCCLQCDLVRAELRAKQRIVWQDDSLVAYCPFASHLPMLIRLTSLQHEACFEDLCDATIESVSRIVRRFAAWIERLRPGAAYNVCLHTRPPGEADAAGAFHWWLEVFPRITQLAGFEWSSHCTINPMLPESAAADYRKCALAEDPRIQLTDAPADPRR